MTGTRMFIYGIFTDDDKCLYVGHTSRPRSRAANHRARFGDAEFRILKECGSDGLKHERRLIEHYRAKGQATHNKNNFMFNEWMHPPGIELFPAEHSSG